jgi:hypothetical protein
MLEILQGEYQ